MNKGKLNLCHSIFACLGSRDLVVKMAGFMPEGPEEVDSMISLTYLIYFSMGIVS